MTPWERLRDTVTIDMSEADRRRWVLVGLPALAAIVLALVVSPWAVWPVVLVGIQLLAVGAVVYLAVRLALRHR
jgi:hypothetical protein